MIKLGLAKILEEKNITNKTQLARELQMSRNNVNKMLANDEPYHIVLSTIEKLCKTLDIMPNDLFRIYNDDGTIWVSSGIETGVDTCAHTALMKAPVGTAEYVLFMSDIDIIMIQIS